MTAENIRQRPVVKTRSRGRRTSIFNVNNLLKNYVVKQKKIDYNKQKHFV